MIQELRGKWALVTGASSGIGMQFALDLAKNGLHLVLVARRERLLNELAKKLEAEYSIRTIVVKIDLCDEAAAEALRSKVEGEGVRLNLLVNNAGAGVWGRFVDAPIDRFVQIVQLNNIAMVSICHTFHSHLAESHPSAVINVSSQAAYQPIPYMAVYAASKAFVHSFSQALSGEWQDDDIEVQTFVPGPTVTEFDDKAGAYSTSTIVKRELPDVAVEASLKALGKKRPVVGAVKGLYRQRVLSGVIPERLLIKEVKKMFRPPNS